jgi:hypothetical protein
MATTKNPAPATSAASSRSTATGTRPSTTAPKLRGATTETHCRGKWSVCKGKNLAKSEDWHLCDGPGSCTEKRAKAMKAAKLGKAVPSASKHGGQRLTSPKGGKPVTRPSGTTMERELAAVQAMKKDETAPTA